VTITGILALLFVMGMVGYVMLGRLQANQRANIRLTVPPCSQRTTPGSARQRCAPKGSVSSDDRITWSAFVGSSSRWSSSHGRGAFMTRMVGRGWAMVDKETVEGPNSKTTTLGTGTFAFLAWVTADHLSSVKNKN
jgi:hypothetical protein